MNRLVSEISLDAADEWFKIGKKAYKDVHTFSKSKTGGSSDFDLVTQKPRVVNEETYIPSYLRGARDETQRDYATSYLQEEENHLFETTQPQQHGVHDATERMSEIDIDSICTSAVAMPDDLIPSNAVDVYLNYKFQHSYDVKMPITRHHQQVVSTIECNQVTVVQGSTGSGKTTQVPQYILDHYAAMNKYCNIIVTQPRRIAAISIARRVCSERDWQLGTVCGYQVGMDKQTSEDTRLTYVTTGVLLQKLINTKNMLQFTHVILDEVHERDQDTDFSLLVVRKLLRTNSPHVKVVLMSATIESEMFASYFALPLGRKLEPAPVISVEGKIFAVSEYYTEDLSVLGEVPPLDEGSPAISQEAYSMAVRLIQEFDSLEAKDQGISPTGFANFRGTVLVFLPGQAEIEFMDTSLQERCQKHNLRILPLHSSITLEEQSKVFEMPGTGERKIILSTNIAESSITVPDIKYVIDFCLTKNLVADAETNYTSLQTEWASRANCNQRKGRSGRVSNGRVYRMITRYFWEHFIQDFGIPEMQRCPLERVILHVKVLDLGEPKAILALALSPPNLDDIEKTILLLKEVGALSTPTHEAGCRHDGDLTFVGRVLADVPVDVRLGKLLILGHVFGLLEDCLIIAAALSLKSVFASPYKKHLEAYRHKLEWAAGSSSDCIAILNAYREWEKRKMLGDFKRRSQKEVSWGRMHFLQIKRLYEVQELVKELESRLSSLNIQKPRQTPNYKRRFSEDQERLLLKVVMAGAFYPNFFIKEPIDEQESNRIMSGHDPFNTVMVKGLPANQGSLYKSAVEDHFRDVGYRPSAFFEETKQLRLPLEIQLLSREEAYSLVEQQELAKEPQKGCLRTNRITVSDQPQDDQKYMLPPPSTSAVQLCVTEVKECGHFWAQYSERENYNALVRIHTCLNQGRSLMPLVGRIMVGKLCAAPFEDEAREYYRARVDGIIRTQLPRTNQFRESLEVFFVDYGNMAVVAREDVRELPEPISEVPFQCVDCYLSGVRPSVVKCPDGRWTEQANNTFRSMVMNKELFGKVYSVVRGVVRMELIEVLRNGRQICFNHELISLEFADAAEESFLSKQNHDQRVLEETTGQLGQTGPQGQSNKQQTSWLNLALKPSTSMTFGESRRGGKVNLRGPNNPYEMAFTSMTNAGSCRCAKIEPGSINCVAIDDEPHDPHSRLMIAAFVGLNPGGSTMMARDTTVMPLIPGLPSIISLLFAPITEFRTDPGLTRLTGAICGLGPALTMEYSCFPDHDIEVIFDTKIDLEDIYKINGVRMAINIAIGSQEKVMGWGPDAVYKIQDSARTKVMEVLQKRRETVQPRSAERPYKWNQLKPEDILHHRLENTDADNPVLLNLHSAVALIDEEVDQIRLNSSAHHKERLKQHVKFLKKAAKDLYRRDPITCELCNMTANTPQLLASHLDMRKHREREEALEDDED
ncbi:putative ATP-dependent RNA helicase TDRD9 [Mizuhopecten yessoensis]|uniref:putative ATP-dependent RNA helicase TDRD9 n=1 Tax=Mizuhopecten yessoensis TaxID=6573 RepID=UPI000B45A2ED|nr:putative ATP-dependent RNA helicase TDRD9 [Mizuhopecten yessoensis]